MSNNEFVSDQQVKLVFIIHGLRGTPKKLADLERLAKVCYPEAKVCVPILFHTSLFSRVRAPELVKNIISQIDTAYSKCGYGQVVIIGHSMGAVLARRVIVEARGLDKHWHPKEPKVEAPLCDIGEHPWAEHVALFVMMASISRGWSVQNAKSTIQRIQWSVGAVIGHLLPAKLKPTLFDFRQGSPFIVQTRLRWLEYCRKYQGERPRVIQFLGTADDVAPPNDTIDFATDADGLLFSQVELPHSTHSTLLNLYEKPSMDSIDKQKTTARREIVKAVLTDQIELYQDQLVRRDFVVDELPPAPDTTVKDIVFVVHGIRDKGYWTKKIASRIKDKAFKNGKEFVSRTPSYGYFPILPFLLPWYRRQKVEWLMDHYVEAAATYPEADIHFMGHSNGTYLGARALIDYPIVSFKRIMFVGSVVRPDFPWARFVRSGRVEKIFNIVATADWVVSIFPNGLRPLQAFFDLGGAGHRGFDEKEIPDALYQMDLSSGVPNAREYVKGGHSAGRAETLWTSIADFFVTGAVIPVGTDRLNFEDQQPFYSKVLGWLAPLIISTIAVLVIGTGLFGVWAFAWSLKGTTPFWLSDWALLYAWADQPTMAQIAILGIYFVILRFMAIRF